jgi:CHAD domain-containing protein
MAPDFPDRPLSESAGRRLELATDQRYRLRVDETAGAGVRRVAHGRVEATLTPLRREAGTDTARAVHDARKDLKKLRSLLRLVRDGLDKREYKAESRRYRDAGRLLAGAREAEVKLDTLAALRERYGDELPATDDLERLLAAERDRIAQAGAADFERKIEQAAATIAAGGTEIDRLDLPDGGFELLRPGVERSYRRGRDHLRALGDDPSDEDLHEWRKRVKDLWYHLRLLRPVWPAAMRAPIDVAHDLADVLGDHHDLAVLIADVEAREPVVPVAGDEARELVADSAELVALARRRQRELLADAVALAAPLYAEKPKRFADRLAAYWESWRDGGAS